MRRIMTFLAFLCGLVVLLEGASYLYMPKNNTAEFGMEEVFANGILGEKENTIDVIVIGDSESFTSITPMQIWMEKGYTSYVCGTSGQTLDYSLTLLKRAFQKQKPKFVIFETNAIYREVLISDAILTEMGNCLPVFRYHNRWKKQSWNTLKGSCEYTWTHDYKGYRYSDKVNACTKRKKYMKPAETAIQISALNHQYVKKIKEVCEANNAKLIFLSTPSVKNWSYMHHNGITLLAEELACEYIDLNLMNEEVQIDWEKDTRDKGDHLNHYGAQKVTHYLAEYLNQTNLLEDHRGSTEYEKWNEALKSYNQVVDNIGTSV